MSDFFLKVSKVAPMRSFINKILRTSHSNNKKHKHTYKKLEVGKKNAPTIKIPKGFVPIYVRKNEDEEAADMIKYLVPITYLSCPPLKEYFIKQSQDDELEIYFDGPITLPCTPDVFEQLLEDCRKLSEASTS